MTNINCRKILAPIASIFILFILSTVILHAAGPSNATIDNPLKSDSFTGILTDIMNLVATVGAVVVVIFIIFSGYKFVTAGSSDSDRTKAKEMFYYTIIGGAILLGADIIANVVVNTVNTTVGRS